MSTSIKKPQISPNFLLDGVAFYGRTLCEYVEMFDFQPDDWHGKKVLDCASGPSSFTAESTKLGVKSVACDPMYEFDLQFLSERAESDMKNCLNKSDSQRHLFEPDACDPQSKYGVEKARAILNFTSDYTRGKNEGRYVGAALPELPFASDSFDLVLSAHLLFVYASKDDGGMFEEERFPLSFHLDAIKEMLRVASKEVRIYPLKGPNTKDSPMLERVLAGLNTEDVATEIVDVRYKDIAGANKMLRIRKQKV